MKWKSVNVMVLVCVMTATGLIAEDPDEWVDPEPLEAQALAEQVVDAPWNADKTIRLKMNILSIVDRTTGIKGFQRELEAADTSLDDRLAKLEAETAEGSVTIRLPGSVLFDFDSASIRSDAARVLREVAEVLKEYGKSPVRVEGHTDSIGTEEYNQKLSESRATSVAEWFKSNGIDEKRLSDIGYGEGKPVAPNDTASGRQKNRRVEIVIETVKK